MRFELYRDSFFRTTATANIAPLLIYLGCRLSAFTFNWLVSRFHWYDPDQPKVWIALLTTVPDFFFIEFTLDFFWFDTHEEVVKKKASASNEECSLILCIRLSGDCILLCFTLNIVYIYWICNLLWYIDYEFGAFCKYRFVRKGIFENCRWKFDYSAWVQRKI